VGKNDTFPQQVGDRVRIVHSKADDFIEQHLTNLQSEKRPRESLSTQQIQISFRAGAPPSSRFLA
jgi:hypothetical protein